MKDNFIFRVKPPHCDIDTPFDRRKYYVEGSGQLYFGCYQEAITDTVPHIVGNQENQYFKTVCCLSIPGRYCFDFLWEPEMIGGTDGFIVQKVRATSTISDVWVPDREFFEAWKVTDGSTVNTDYDDEFSCSYFDGMGVVKYYAEVYWIFETDELYGTIEKWKPNTVPMANNLPATYEFNEIRNQRPVFTREFTYENM